MQTKKQHEVRQVCLKLGGDKAQSSHTVSSEAKRMALDQINWGQFLQPGSELPPDITFRVVEEQSGSDEGDVTKSLNVKRATILSAKLQKYVLISSFLLE